MALPEPGRQTLEPLHGRSGEVYAWLDRDNNRIIGLTGYPLAFIVEDSLYNWRGQHLGWWIEDHIRDQAGRVALFLRRAKALGPVLPRIAAAPRPPIVGIIPAKPARAPKPVKPEPLAAWAPSVPF